MFERITYLFAGIIYMAWTLAILIGFWYVDIYLFKFPVLVECAITAPAVCLCLMAYSFLHSAFTKERIQY